MSLAVALIAARLLMGMAGQLNTLHSLPTTPSLTPASSMREHDGVSLCCIAGGSMMITHKFVEFSTNGDDKMVRPRMVMLGAVQAYLLPIH